MWAHSRGSMVSSDSRNITLHHNIIYRNYKRNPLIQSSDGNIINNVIVNYQYQAYIQPFEASVRANFIGNYFRSYIHNRPPIRVFDYNKGYDGNSSIYYKDNYDAKFRPLSTQLETDIRVLHPSKKTNDNDDNVKDRIKAHLFEFVEIQPVHEAYELVLKEAGAIYPKRDSADKRIVAFIKSGKAPQSLINDPKEVGGWPILKGGKASIDSDNDGIPDNWERLYGLDSNNSKDANLKNLSLHGYTNLELYLNSIINYCE